MGLTGDRKRIYHPLVIFYFYAGLLTPEQLAQIPKTTLDYWKRNDHTSMFGYDWVSTFYSNHDDFNKIQKRKIIFKSVRLCGKLFYSFSYLCAGIKNYKKTFKNNFVKIIETIDYLATEIPFEKACRIFNLSPQQYYRWKNKINCSASVLNLCFKTHPHQLTLAEGSVIKEAINDPANELKKLASIFYTLMRENKLGCSLSTFYKYVALLSERIGKHKYTKLVQSLQSCYPLQFIHIDTTWLQTVKEGRIRAVIVKDNYSKKILHQSIVDNGHSHWIARLMREVFSMYGLASVSKPVAFVSDGGSENKGEVIEWIESLHSLNVTKLIAKTERFNYTNNEIESTFNIFKNEFIAYREIIDKKHAQQVLSDFQLYNNTKRYPLALYGLTPQEVFDGATPDKHRFKENIKQAAAMRYQKNKAGRFCDVCAR